MRVHAVLGFAALGSCGRVDFDTRTDALVERGLIVRYFLDEAASGQDVQVVRDAARDPLDLTARYDVIAGPEFIEDPNGRALRFRVPGGGGGPCGPVADKLLRLVGTTTATIELVADVIASNGDTSESRFMHVGNTSAWGFDLAVTPAGLSFDHSEASPFDPVRWIASLERRGRTVITLSLDTNRAAPDDRARLYLDGEPAQPVLTSSLPLLGEAVAIRTDQYFCIGNRWTGLRTFEGAISYLALYDAALEPSEVLANYAELQRDDDRR